MQQTFGEDIPLQITPSVPTAYTRPGWSSQRLREHSAQRRREATRRNASIRQAIQSLEWADDEKVEHQQCVHDLCDGLIDQTAAYVRQLQTLQKQFAVTLQAAQAAQAHIDGLVRTLDEIPSSDAVPRDVASEVQRAQDVLDSTVPLLEQSYAGVAEAASGPSSVATPAPVFW